MKKNTLIVAGGKVNLDLLSNFINNSKPSIIIAVDKGLEALNVLNIIPNHIVGDFDSVSKHILDEYTSNIKITVHSFNPKKDNTDTDIALELAISLQSSSITIIGGLGGRIDHSLSNIHILTKALEAKIPCQILDENNRVFLLNSNFELTKDHVYGKYISLIPLTSKVDRYNFKRI